MVRSVGIVRSWRIHEVSGDVAVVNAASLVKQIFGHIALVVVDDLDTRVEGDITVRHILSHTTGLPNWRPEGEPLTPLRPAGQQWGYSGEGFVLLQRHLEYITNRTIDHLADEHVFGPLDMTDS